MAAAVRGGGESALIHGPPETIERAEIRELKRKLAEAEMERDVLKKALAYFAKEKRP